MSQQYPGQPAGGGAMPPGYGGVVGQVAPGLAQPPKTDRMLLLVGMGCGLFLLFAVAAVVAGLYWFKTRANSTVQDLQRLITSASAIAAIPEPPSGASVGTEPGRELTGDCQLAYDCCRAIAAKSPAGAAAVQACEVFKTAGYPQSICTDALTGLKGYRKVAELAGVKCEE